MVSLLPLLRCILTARVQYMGGKKPRTLLEVHGRWMGFFSDGDGMVGLSTGGSLAMCVGV